MDLKLFFFVQLNVEMVELLKSRSCVPAVHATRRKPRTKKRVVV